MHTALIRYTMKKRLILAIHAALEAGEEILKIYNDPNSDFGVERKSDNSPLTIADKAGHNVIMGYLTQLDYPIISEEGKNMPYADRKDWTQLWMVDPLDGTKEFIKKNGEFTVNIAFIENGAPTMGVIYVPVQKALYFGEKSMGAYRVDNITFTHPSVELVDIIAKGVKLPETRTDDAYRVVASRSHQSQETIDYIEMLKKTHSKLEFVNSGSSIKICMVAEGSADVYPRFAPTMEWDTAAGHAIAIAAGKEIYHTHEETPLIYNKENLLNPHFIVK